jgi:TPP-dependent pyruvate/acetoin dehydrogenase alpha subunit
MRLSDKTMVKMYEDMCMIRTLEEKVDELFSQGKVTGTCHLGVGQEAVMTGIHHALEKNDYVALSHRSHGLHVLRGLDINILMAEMCGRENGICKGRGGSIHLMDMEHRNLGVTTGIIGQSIPIAVGAALTLKMKKSSDILLCTFGDGATNNGGFHEGLNLASIWKAPVVLFCENNQYAMGTPIRDAINIDDLSIRAESYGIPGYRIDGNNVLEVYETVRKACKYVRSGMGPVLIVAETYRWKGHAKADMQKYRTKEEVDVWKLKCPIKRLQNILVERGLLDDEKMEAINIRLTKIVDDAVEFALASPFPKEESIYDYTYCEGVRT